LKKQIEKGKEMKKKRKRNEKEVKYYLKKKIIKKN
jgi:hypothetical protein